MSGQGTIASIPPEARAALAQQRSDAAGLRHLTGSLGALATTGALIALQAPFWWLLLPLHGVILIFLFALEHEAPTRRRSPPAPSTKPSAMLAEPS